MKKKFVLLAFAFCGLFAVDANAGIMTIVCPNGDTSTITVADKGSMDDKQYYGYLQGIADAYCKCTAGNCSAKWTVRYTLEGGGEKMTP